MINKVYPTVVDALADVPDGSMIMVGGFGGSGLPVHLLQALAEKGARGLTLVCNNVGGVEYGVGVLVTNRQVKKILCSFPIGRTQAKMQDSFWEQYQVGELEVELVPQGTLSERIRAGGAGIPAFYTPTGTGTKVANGKESRVFEGREYLLEHALKADYAFVKAHKADRMGNLVYRKAQRNFNIMMATAARVTVAEVSEIVEVGELDPETVVTPGIFVQRVVAVP